MADLLDVDVAVEAHLNTSVAVCPHAVFLVRDVHRRDGWMVANLLRHQPRGPSRLLVGPFREEQLAEKGVKRLLDARVDTTAANVQLAPEARQDMLEHEKTAALWRWLKCGRGEDSRMLRPAVADFDDGSRSEEEGWGCDIGKIALDRGEELDEITDAR